MLIKNRKTNKNLFICCTPLQGLIAKRIIETKKLKKEDCVFFFYTSFDNEVYRNYYQELEKLCIEGCYYVWKPNFPKYIIDAKRFFKKNKFTNYYFASVDSFFVHFALSNTKKPNIYTFDDGSANIVLSGNYFKSQKLNFKRIIYNILGNKYSANKIKNKIIEHYTIFPGLKNISNNLVELSLFPIDHAVSKNDKKCTVVLGTVYNELFEDTGQISGIKQKIINSINNSDQDIFYIPHPREEYWKIENLSFIKTRKIAEDVILELRTKYSTIDLLSFGSTTQLNLALVPGINNIFFTHNQEIAWLKDLRAIEQKITGEQIKTISLN